VQNYVPEEEQPHATIYARGHRAVKQFGRKGPGSLGRHLVDHEPVISF